MSVSFKQLNPGMLSAARGGELIVFGFRTSIGTQPTSLWQLGSNAVDSVTWNSAGNFTVQMNKAWPREIAHIECSVQSALATTNEIGDARYVLDSYDAADGAFEVMTFTDNGDGTLTVEDLVDNTVITVFMVVQRVDALVTAHT
jgi:hypothetical protein